MVPDGVVSEELRQNSQCLKEVRAGKISPEIFSLPVDTEEKADREARERLAKEVCGRCAVSEECLIFALKNKEKGVWGGYTDGERRRIRDGRLPI